MNLELQEMTRPRMHTLYQGFQFDPNIFPGEAPVKNYEYCPQKVDALYDLRVSEEGSKAFAVLLDGVVIGEVGLRRISGEERSCELSIQLQNDSVKNKGYGTAAERLAVAYAFTVLDLQSVWAETLEKNRRSQHVLEKLGFQYQSTHDGYRCYRLERKDWEYGNRHHR